MDIKFYSLEEVAEMLDVDYQLIYKQVKSGNMPSIRIGKLYRISTLQFQEYLNRQSTGIPATGTSEHACSLCGKNTSANFQSTVHAATAALRSAAPALKTTKLNCVKFIKSKYTG